MKKHLRIIIYILIPVVIAALGVGAYFAALGIAKNSLDKRYELKSITESIEKNKIYFFNTGNSDAILIESNGRYGMVDCGEDSQNPRNLPGLELDGYEEEVLRLVKSICGDEDGNVYLDFILGTHAHSDHIGGFDTLIADESINIGIAYLKPYDSDKITDYEVKNWDNSEVYKEMTDALNARNIPIEQNLTDVSFKLGDLQLTIYNGELPQDGVKVGENENSLGVLLNDGTHKVFLAGDINDYDGDETRLAPLIGKVDVLKLGHHGIDGSTGNTWAKTLKPDIAIQTTSDWRSLSMDHRLTFVSKSSVYPTVKYNGIALGLGDKLQLYKDVNTL